MEILGVIDEGTLTENGFYQTIDSCRNMIKDQFCQPIASIRQLIEEDPDSRLTYSGMKTFVKIDLENTSLCKHAASRKEYIKDMSNLALHMMARSEGFGHLIRAVMPNHIRLSIHPSYGTAKLSICLVPQLPGCQARAPWMSCIAVDRNGANHTAHVKDVRLTHQLIYRNELPWLYTEREAPGLPDFILARNQLFDDMWVQYVKELESKPRTEITVTVSIGKRSPLVVNATSWLSTPASLLSHFPEDCRSKVVVAKVDGHKLWDLSRPLERDCIVALLLFDHSEGRQTFWRSCASCLAEVCEQEFHCLLAENTPTAQGFFCDMDIPGERAVTNVDRELLNKRISQIAQEGRGFDRLEVSKEILQRMFSYNRYKLHAINQLVEGETAIVYRSGTLVDISCGPHIPEMAMIKAFKATQSSSAYFLGHQNQDSLQRISGIAFPEKSLLQEHLKFLEEARNGHHLKIGKKQELFLFHELSPGSPFLLPRGVRVFNALQKLLRTEYHLRGYDEVQTPNMYDASLWKTSGHWAHYKEDMFRINLGRREWALKPMNCPGHFLLYTHKDRSYRELPLRVADFGVLHRNEASGALHGLTRVRKFQQDDGHIICRLDQITSEIEGIFDFLKHVYDLFGFTFNLTLSTRPPKYLGDIDTWNEAEEQLRKALTRFKGNDWTVNPGDGAFYGPKIDITIADALQRQLQCATIQLDYQAAMNFQMSYATDKGGRADRPVVIHRAIIGSFERFIGILIEHFAGKWPFWISPRQILILPVTSAQNRYAEELQRILRADKLHVDIDVRGHTLNKKIRCGQEEQYNFIFGDAIFVVKFGCLLPAVVGAEEQRTRTVNVRNRDERQSQVRGALIPLDEVRVRLKSLKKNRRLANIL
ncbi:hypothetical protein N7474_008580 [Penicillium riverlandense]|uniref:uncharacterized protein n=1 Tax=Penicillium riverlandense TaxID=1903569 RepID=UPI0025493480|nr:uncharacterized protein N7474_008580 [Penicillium riverlandense]KAJ5812279.1 hypothetical protein N7474_008580 [Penicillium riverlandense]